MPEAGEEDLAVHVANLVEIAGQQAVVMRTLAEQVRVLCTLNAALLGTLRSQIDIEVLRERVLGVFTGEPKESDAVNLINLMLGPVKTEANPPSEEEMRQRLREAARARFTIINGGGPGPGRSS